MARFAIRHQRGVWLVVRVAGGSVAFSGFTREAAARWIGGAR